MAAGPCSRRGNGRSGRRRRRRSGPTAYITALAAYCSQQGGIQPQPGGLSKALAWLRTHQTGQGYWAAESMNHKHETGTVPEKFMSDAATGYATAALLAAGNEGIQRTASNSKASGRKTQNRSLTVTSS